MKKIIALIVMVLILSGGNCMAESLNNKQQNIVMIASYTANGDLQNLERALN